MAKSQESGTTILLGLKDYKVEEVRGGEERVVKTAVTGKEKKCPYCGSARLYRHGMCKPREVLHTWSSGRRIYLELHRHRWRCRDCGHTFAEGRQLVRSRSRLTRQAEWLFPLAKVVVDPFHVIADSNRRMDEARRIEQDVYRGRKVQIPKKIFLTGRGKLSDEKREKVDELLDRYPGLKGFYWAKEKMRELYRQASREEATKLLDNIIFNLKSADDAELIKSPPSLDTREGMCYVFAVSWQQAEERPAFKCDRNRLYLLP